jgi:hypothetical protein
MDGSSARADEAGESENVQDDGAAALGVVAAAAVAAAAVNAALGGNSRVPRPAKKLGRPRKETTTTSASAITGEWKKRNLQWKGGANLYADMIHAIQATKGENAKVTYHAFLARSKLSDEDVKISDFSNRLSTVKGLLKRWAEAHLKKDRYEADGETPTTCSELQDTLCGLEKTETEILDALGIGKNPAAKLAARGYLRWLVEDLKAKGESKEHKAANVAFYQRADKKFNDIIKGKRGDDGDSDSQEEEERDAVAAAAADDSARRRKKKKHKKHRWLSEEDEDILTSTTDTLAKRLKEEMGGIRADIKEMKSAMKAVLDFMKEKRRDDGGKKKKRKTMYRSSSRSRSSSSSNSSGSSSSRSSEASV